jgi:hypothetical protein
MSQLPDCLSTLEDAIRRSVLADCYEVVPDLLDGYSAGVEARLRDVPEELPILQARASELLEWVGQLVQASREETLGSMSHLQQLSAYRTRSAAHLQAEA